MQLVSTVTLGSAAASIEFTSIPQTGTDLLLVCNLRSTAASTGRSVQMQFNNVTTDVYSSRYLGGDGSSTTSGTDSSGFGFFNWTLLNQGTNTTTNTFASSSFYIPNYASSVAKSVSVDAVYENNATAAWQMIHAGRFNSTTAITSIKIYDSVNFAQHSSASLYIITKA